MGATTLADLASSEKVGHPPELTHAQMSVHAPMTGAHVPEEQRGIPVMQHLNPLVLEFVPQTRKTNEATNMTNWKTVAMVPQEDTTPRNDSQAQLHELTRSLAEQITLGRLPAPEPGIFTGDPLAYPGWKSAFETLIENRGIPPAEKFHYLKRYLGGHAKEAVEGYFLLNTEAAFEEAKALLHTRYGNPFVVADAFRNKLLSWSKISTRDSLGLRCYADFLRQCLTAMRTVESLRVLHDEQENRKMITKLPEWLVLRWTRVVAHTREQRQQFPTFDEFIHFVTQEANIVCDPISSVQLQKQDSVERPRKGPAGARSLLTGGKEAAVGIQKQTVEKGDRDTDRVKRARCCFFCKASHDINERLDFPLKPIEDKKEFASKRGLCHGCLRQGHRFKECRSRKVCDICSKHHPTELHVTADTSTEKCAQTGSDSHQTSVTAQSNPTTLAGHLNNTTSGSKETMIVPVWVSHEQNCEEEILVYALLDTQSDTTFVLSGVSEALNAPGVDTRLMLSTMSAQNHVTDSTRVKGL